MADTTHSHGSPQVWQTASRAWRRENTVTRAGHWAETAIFWGLIACLGLAPLWFGSNRDFAWRNNAAAVGFLLVARTLLAASNGEVRAHDGAAARVLAWPVLLVTIVAAWVVCQALPVFPPSVVNRYWTLAAQALDKPFAGTISIAPGLTLGALQRLLTDAGVFLLAVAVCRGARRTETFLIALLVIFAAYCGYGLVWTMTGHTSVLGLEKTAYRLDVTATFVNRNSFATFAALGSVLALELTAHYWRRWRYGGSWLPLFGTCVCGAVIGAGLAQSHSRAGIAVALAGTVTVALLRLSRPTTRPALRLLKLVVLLGATAAAIALAVALGASRLARSEEDFASRLQVYHLVFDAVKELPWTGYGFGVFELLFPIIRDQQLSPFSTWDKAHNSYLELMVGIGIPAALLLFLALVWLVCLALGAAVRSGPESAAARVAVAVGVVVGLHSLLDFSIQIQGVSLMFYGLLGAGVANARPAAAAPIEPG